VPHGGITALQGLRDAGGIKPDQKVLIIGASGDVGTFAVQIARSLGAEVTGVCSTMNMDMVRSIGADHVIDYKNQDFIHTISGKQYDLILDTGGNRSLLTVRRALTPTGTLVLVGGEGGDRWIGRGTWRSVRALVLSRFVSQRLRPVLATPNTSDLVVLKQLIEAARMMPIINRTYSLSDTADAIRQLEEGHARGKVVITV
jgi:NADPH:quinone reductase-like Zn-dependent oxidoreductase